MSDGEEDETIEKWCEWCGKKEGVTGTIKFCGESKIDSGGHSFIQREVVEAAIAKQYTFACGTCPDSKAYPGGSRPNMKTSSGGRTCRNSACEKYKKPEVKSEASEPSAKRSRTSLGRKGKMPTNATDEEKTAIRDQQKEVAELRAQLEIGETKLRLMLEAKKMDEDEGEEAAE